MAKQKSAPFHSNRIMRRSKEEPERSGGGGSHSEQQEIGEETKRGKGNVREELTVLGILYAVTSGNG